MKLNTFFLVKERYLQPNVEPQGPSKWYTVCSPQGIYKRTYLPTKSLKTTKITVRSFIERDFRGGKI